MQTNPPRVIAIDPGYERMGVAILEKTTRGEILLYSDCIITSRTLSFPDRLGHISEALRSLIALWQPEVCATEKLYFSNNQKTAMRVAEVRGVIIEVARSCGLAIAEYNPHEVKVAVTGYGQAGKAQVATMVRRLVVIHQPPRYDDEYDAIAIGLTHLASKKIST